MSLHHERVNSEFKRALSEALREIKDPRMSSMVSISEVQVSGDLKHAKVRVSIYDSPEAQKESLDVLKRASGLLKSKVNRLIRLRRMPDMHFELDDGIEYSVHIASLLDSIQPKYKEAEEEETSSENGDE